MINYVKRISNQKSNSLIISSISDLLLVRRQISNCIKTTSTLLNRKTVSKNSKSIESDLLPTFHSINKFIHLTSIKTDQINYEDELNKPDDSIVNQINFEDHLIKKEANKELVEFNNDLNTLTLSEFLRKYEYSIKDALKLDPNEQKRIVIKGLVVTKYIYTKANLVKIKLWDTNSFQEISVMMSYDVFRSNKAHVNCGSSVVLTGLVFKNRETKINSLYCDKLVHLNETSLDYEYKLYRAERTIMDWFNLRNYPSMKFRSHRYATLLKLRSTLINQIHKLMVNEHIVNVTPPTLTYWPLAGDDVFIAKNKNRDDYFPLPAYLNKECDKHLETIVTAIPQIYSINHSFSADQTRSKQMANETLSLEVAQLTDDSIEDLMNQVEYFIKKLTSTYSSLHSNIIDKIMGERGMRAEFAFKNIDFDYVRMTYDEALELLRQKEIHLEYGDRLNNYHKKLISDYFQKNPFFIYNFPYELSTDFDTLQIDNKAQRFEFIVGNGLSMGKGKIKSRASHKELLDKLTQLNCNPNEWNVDWYLELKKKGGAMPSTWFALSLDLYVMALTDLPSVRDAIPFPRVPNHCEM